MKRIHVDWQKCTGCMRCMLACSAAKEGQFRPARARIHMISNPRNGLSVPLVCYQCDDAPCLAACPVEALVRNDAGAVVVIDDFCTGCGACAEDCPFGMIEVVDDIAVKCDLCGGEPECVKVCPTEALVYDDVSITGEEFKDIKESEGTPHQRRQERAVVIFQELASI